MLEQFGMSRDVLDRARRSRDARFDGKFFIAVTSTRIYCRSICPARTSKDANVRYYATAAEAAAAGFRPCLRCRPESAPGSPAWLGTSAVVRRALRLIQEGALDNNSVEDLATRLGVGARHLSRLFARHVGASPGAVAQTRRLHFAKQLLDETRLPITAIALGSGFRSVRRFNAVFKAMYRRSPRELRKAGGRTAGDALIRLRLTYRPPYDWQRLTTYLAQSAIPGVEAVENDVYRRTVPAPGGHAVVEVRPLGAADAVELCVRGAESSQLLALSSVLRRVLDLAADPARIAEVLEADPHLRPAVIRRPGLRIPGCWDLFESGVRALLGRGGDLSQERAALAQLVETCGGRLPEADGTLRYLFPTPEAVARLSPTTLALPPDCSAALIRLAHSLQGNAPVFYGASDQVIPALAQSLQVDQWTAGYMALRGLGEPDAMPVGDRIVQRRLLAEGHALTEGELAHYAEGWRPFRGYAVWHLWEAEAEDRAQR
jgi:AraC family transcriptional regulator, regulatory protein of adaptative response / DNA-3-methyladenine glycosylase II